MQHIIFSICFGNTSPVQLINAEMFKSVYKLKDRKRPLVKKLAALITCREIYRTAGRLSRRERNATLVFTSNPINTGSEYSLFCKIGACLVGNSLVTSIKETMI